MLDEVMQNMYQYLLQTQKAEKNKTIDPWWLVYEEQM